MSQADRQRWDQKWREMAGKPFTPHPLLVKNQNLLSGGRALDLACGLGQNSIWLAGLGYQVLGVDVSGVALSAAASRARKLDMSDSLFFTQMDLDQWSLPTNMFDLICVFRFLNRRLFPEIRTGLRPGGLLFYSTRHVGILNRRPDANQDFLLQPDELITVFSDWEIVHYEEGVENARIIARNN
jgi:SAM-dependent methyltransferase